ncbi:MAG: malonyl-ACP O-methyltransferase BioC [Chromatiales bacterium]|nr:malonyl-ACP O-methyltransferase BioC [Chromatiales bacterium]
MIDPKAARRAFDHAATSYDAAAVVQREVGRRLIERLALMRARPARVLDLGSGTGETTEALAAALPGARITELDFAPAMLARARSRVPWGARLKRRRAFVCADCRRLPFADASFDFVFSNLALQWAPDADAQYREIARVLAPGGLLLFSTLGSDTLAELRVAFAAADHGVHVHPFADLHDVGDALLAAGLAEPVMDCERITLTYAAVGDLLRDLKDLGAHNADSDRARGLSSPRAFARMRERYERERDADGRLPATWDIVYGHAWGAAPRPMSALHVAPPRR